MSIGQTTSTRGVACQGPAVHHWLGLLFVADNEWFLASCSWPCRPEDLEERTHLLLRLAESTAQRDALEILSNLPGLKEPNGEGETPKI